MPAPEFPHGRLILRPPLSGALGKVAVLHNEVAAYLTFQYLRSLKEVDAGKVLLSSTETPNGPEYHIFLRLGDDLLQDLPDLLRLQVNGFIRGYTVDFAAETWLHELSAETRLFEAAYNIPIRRKLLSLRHSLLLSSTAQFILFKSKTDRRIREQIEPIPPALSLQQATDLSADIIAVAHFYSLPLDFFLGIGAMENNYMSINGDLAHAIWKKRAAPGDVILRRRRGRVLVRNYSIGVWQIGLETLRYVHALYLNDKRDYSALPARLRPPQVLDLHDISTGVLTTYAGLLFRQLLDHFDGNVRAAAAAYNGGSNHPNPKYGTGVAEAAEFARRTLEQAAVLNDRNLASMRFVLSSNPPRD